MHRLFLKIYPLFFWEFPQNQANYSSKLSLLYILDNSFTLSLAEKSFCWMNRWVLWTNDYNAKMESGNNYRRPVEVLSAVWGFVVSWLTGPFTDSDSMSSYCGRKVASRSHAYYWRSILHTINRRGSARLEYVAHVRHFNWTFHISSRIFPDYSQFLTFRIILEIIPE